MLPWVFYLKRDYDQMMEQAKAAVELAPNLWLGRLQLGLAHEKKRDFARALQELEEAGEWTTIPAFWRCLPAPMLLRAGPPDEARRITEEMVERSKKRYVLSCLMRLLASFAGVPTTSQLLVAAKIPDAPAASWIAVDPKFDPLARGHRLQDLLRRLGLPP